METARRGVVSELNKVHGSLKNMEELAENVTKDLDEKLYNTSEDISSVLRSLDDMSARLDSISKSQKTREEDIEEIKYNVHRIEEFNRESKSRIIYRLPNDKQKQILVTTANELAKQTIDVVQRVFTLEVERYKHDAKIGLEKAEEDLKEAFNSRIPDLALKLRSQCNILVQRVKDLARNAELQDEEMIEQVLDNIKSMKLPCDEKDVELALRELILPIEDGSLSTLMEYYKSSLIDALEKLPKQTSLPKITKKDMSIIKLRDLKSRISIIEIELMKSIDNIISRIGVIRNRVVSTNLTGLLEVTGTTDFPSAVKERVSQICKAFFASQNIRK